VSWGINAVGQMILDGKKNHFMCTTSHFTMLEGPEITFHFDFDAISKKFVIHTNQMNGS
jgi:hypothetical protein